MTRRFSRQARINMLFATVPCFLALFTFLAASQSSAASLISNGDFSLGNSGFNSSYVHGALPGGGHYVLTSNPSREHDQAASYGDHTSGSGLMLAVNGSKLADVTVWSQTVNLAAGESYEFSMYLSSWYSSMPAQLRVEANGAAIGEFTAPTSVGAWQRAVTTFNPTTQSTTIRIVVTNPAGVGVDFAIDD